MKLSFLAFSLTIEALGVAAPSFARDHRGTDFGAEKVAHSSVPAAVPCSMHTELEESTLRNEAEKSHGRSPIRPNLRKGDRF